VIVRSDLPLGFLVAQACHAAGESSPGDLDPGTYAVVLDAKDERALAALERKFQKAGIPHVAIREPDKPWNNALTAIGLVPTRNRDAIRRLTSSMPLLGKGAMKIIPIKEIAKEVFTSTGCRECDKEGPSATCYTCNGGIKRVREEVTK
jgi:peptidyl-tRNA hydrolase